MLHSLSALCAQEFPKISRNCAKVYKFVPAMGSDFPRIVHCSYIACSQLVHFYLFVLVNKYK